MPRFSAELLDYARWPRRMGQLAEPTAVGHASLGGRAPRICLYLRIGEGRIGEATFEASGCGVSIAACSALLDLVIGSSVEDALRIDAQCIVEQLHGVPDDKRYCVDLALVALHNALNATGGEEVA